MAKPGTKIYNQPKKSGSIWSKKTAGRSHQRSSQWEFRRQGGQIFYVSKDGETVKLPPSGPPNTLVRSGSILPFPKEEPSQRTEEASQ